ncbi:MAG: YHYH protein [Pseudomonadota bacterium]
MSDAGFGDVVSVVCIEGEALLRSDTYPDHVMLTGIVATNEQTVVPAVNYTSPIRLAPSLTSEAKTRDAALGIAVNGVPIYDYTGGGEMSQGDLAHYQAMHDTIATQQLDLCGGHAGRGDDYHYHAAPTCMIETMLNAGPGAIIGWAFDGFPIYGDLNPDGSEIADGDLDICNGQPDETYGYRYHTSTEAPFIIQCLMGEIGDMKDLPRVQPLSDAAGGRGPKAGKPPKGGVENLEFTQDTVTGLRSLTYSYKGGDYYINYRPSNTPNCYHFETKTITNNGEVNTSELCRR